MPLLRRHFLRNRLFSIPALGLSTQASQAETTQPGAFIVPVGKTRTDGPWAVHGEPCFYDKIASAEGTRSALRSRNLYSRSARSEAASTCWWRR